MLIGIAGYAQSGKDTAGRYLHDMYGFNQHAFANKLKELAMKTNAIIPVMDDTAAVWGLSGSQSLLVDKTSNSTPTRFYSYGNVVSSIGIDAAKENIVIRKFLQDLGVGAREVFGKDFWVEQLWKELDTKYGFYTKDLGVQTPQSNIVITDVRFENEAQAIRDAGGIVIRLIRGEAVNEHVSEKPLPPQLIDYEIDNTGTTVELYDYLDEVLKKEEFIGIGKN